MAQKSFYLSSGLESRTFLTAFYRFLEVHSRTLVGSENTCSIKTIKGGGLHTNVVTLWSEHAVSDFVRFWDDYRRVYGQEPPGDRAGVSRSVSQDAAVI